MLSLSTAFHINRCREWRQLLDETYKLGFKCLELNVAVPESMLREALVSVEKKAIVISSLHNYCPRSGEPSTRTDDLFRIHSKFG